MSTSKTLRGEKGEPEMIQTLAARIQLAKMQAEEGQALVEYALILALISVVAIGVLEIIGVNVTGVLGRIGNDL
jgi:Flp pilus assembly pilin Flp